jgi:hypothetical protein
MMLTGVVKGETAQVPVRITGMVVGDLVARPASLQSLNPTARGHRFAPVTIASTNDKAFRILSVDAGPHVDAQFEDRKQGKEYAIRTTLKDGVPEGPFATALTIRTDNTGQPVLTIPIFVNVKPRYSVEPGVALLGPDGTAAMRRIRIQSGSPTPFEILSVSCDNPQFMAGEDETQPHMPDVKFVVVRVRQGTPPDAEMTGEVVLKTNIPGAEEVRIPFEFSPNR